MMKTIILTGCLMTLATTGAFAAPVVVEAERMQDEVLMERVSFADLDISGAPGLRTLKGRISAAATRVCVNGNPDPLQASLESTTCYRRALDDSYAQIDRILAARKAGTAIAAATVSVGARR